MVRFAAAGETGRLRRPAHELRVERCFAAA